MKFRNKTTGEIIANPIEVLKRIPELQHLQPLGHALRILPSVSSDHGYDFIHPVAKPDHDKPDHDKKNQHLEEGLPEFVDGKWQEKWEVKPGKDPKYKEPKPRPEKGGRLDEMLWRRRGINR